MEACDCRHQPGRLLCWQHAWVSVPCISCSLPLSLPVWTLLPAKRGRWLLLPPAWLSGTFLTSREEHLSGWRSAASPVFCQSCKIRCQVSIVKNLAEDCGEVRWARFPGSQLGLISLQYLVHCHSLWCKSRICHAFFMERPTACADQGATKRDLLLLVKSNLARCLQLLFGVTLPDRNIAWGASHVSTSPDLAHCALQSCLTAH